MIGIERDKPFWEISRAAMSVMTQEEFVLMNELANNLQDTGSDEDWEAAKAFSETINARITGSFQ